MKKRVELGCAGHFICSDRCRWRRHTQIGNYRVSSVGDYFPDGDGGKRGTVGAGKDDLFETMVFRTDASLDYQNDGCGCRHVTDWSEVECHRYATAGEAQKGHERLVSKYGRRK